MDIISITGTKGKTTITRVLSYVLYKSKKNILRVDTDGHYINEKQKSTLDDSKKIFGLVPTVSPGRYLMDMRTFYPDFTAVLETAIGSSASGGLGYGLHQVGIFANVLEDHLGISKRLKTRMDIARAKSFIFSKIDMNGFAVFNADDKYVCSQLKEIPAFRKITLLPVGVNFSAFDIETHLSSGGSCITLEQDFIIIKSAKRKIKILDIKDIYWTFEGKFMPSVYNLMLIIGGLYAQGNKKISQEMIESLKDYKMSEDGGRLTMFQGKSGTKILLDYAHERYSLLEVAKLGKQIAPNGKTIGIVRLAPDRTDKMIRETGVAIANKYDDLIVYDKIDGVNRKKYSGKKMNLTREVGEVSEIFYQGILSIKKSGTTKRILVEEKAIEFASKIAQKNDLVVVICGDDHKKTIGYIKKYFSAS